MIRRLKRDDGSVVERKEEIGPFITDFYRSLFVSSAGPLNDDIFRHINVSVTPEMNVYLTKPFTAEEIREALDAIGDHKAPGPDSMPALFYKRFGI